MSTIHPPLPHAMWASLRSTFWDDARGHQRLAYVVGAALILTGLAHGVVWAVVGGSAEGSLSWRKPVTFGVSFGLTTLTLGWIGGLLRAPTWSGWLVSVLLCGSTALEVLWVSVQRARGVPSHFNDMTALDEALFTGGGVTIAVTVTALLLITVAAFTSCTADAAMAWAIRGGMLALLAAQVVGMWMIVHGIGLLDAGVSPLTHSMTTYGQAGAMKYAHAVPMHAIQVLPGLAWLMGFGRWSGRARLLAISAAIAGYASLFAVALGRTALGLEPFDLVSASKLLYLVPALLLGAASVATAAALRR
ncbi:hypothetical protein ACFFR3_42305 [Nonomuraea salmonea]|uniref:Uncharacterized protein n=1 Tax=Nonomuraea salmonea TaxID=46181 RepID=A0ABV5P2J5_9ACTN